MYIDERKLRFLFYLIKALREGNQVQFELFSKIS